MFQISGCTARLISVVKVPAVGVLVGGAVLAAAPAVAVVSMVVTVDVAVAVSPAGLAVGVGTSGVVKIVAAQANGATYLQAGCEP
jgi:hypothetical protein